MSNVLPFLAALLWWLMLCVAAVLLGSFTVWFGFYVIDAWRDRSLRKRAERLIDPGVRTLVADLDRIWGLPCARDRSAKCDKVALLAAEIDLHRNLPTVEPKRIIEMDGRQWG